MTTVSRASLDVIADRMAL